ncbi:MAG: glycosyltransferase family 2 protein, partial [Planctomycetota bacterium]
MPTWQGMEFLERVLDALAAQKTRYDVDLHVIDSGSTDGTWEFLEEREATFPWPLQLYRIASAEFDHGDTRNQLAARSRGDLLVFLTQDAIPSRTDWLECLARNFEDPRVGAVTCRNVPRADARILTCIFSESDPGYGEERIERTLPDPMRFAAMSGDERRLLYNFNDVASAVRRELWEYFPFPRTMMGEDILMARGLIHAGYTIVHDVEATVDHSHDYGPEKMQWRGFVDGKFNAEWLDRICVATEEDIAELSARLIEGDRARLVRLGHDGAELEALLAEALELRTALVRGLYEGGRSALRYPGSAIRETRKLRLLFVDPDETLRE